MSEFTSRYKVTYGDGRSVTESRIDAGKVFDNAIVPIMIMVALLVAIIASIPFLILLPLIYYAYTPYKRAKNFVKTDVSVKEYSDDFLIKSGHKNLGALYTLIRIKFYFLLIVSIALGLTVDYYVFSNYELKKLLEFSLNMLYYSLPLFLLYPITFLFLHKNRKVLFSLFEIEDTFGQRLYRFIQRNFKKIIFFILFAAALFAGHHFYMQYKKEQGFKYLDIFYEMNYAKDKKEDTALLKDEVEKKSIEINSEFFGDGTLYKLFYKLDKIIYGEEFEHNSYVYEYKSFSYKYKTTNLLEKIATFKPYKGSYKANYKEINQLLKLYISLEGDINLINISTDMKAVARIDTIETYYAFKNNGADFSGAEQNIVQNLVKTLGSKDKGYSKRLSMVFKDLVKTPELAKTLLQELKYDLKSNRQISGLRVLESMAP